MIFSQSLFSIQDIPTGLRRANIQMDSTLGSNSRAVADFQVSRRSHLPRQNAVVANFSRASKPNLPAKNRVLADFTSVAHEH